MEAITPVVPGLPTGAIPSATFSSSVVNAVLGMFLESAATIEEIAEQNGLTIPKVLECLHEQSGFLQGMLSTLELRVRLLSARAEAIAIEALREVAIFARDQEARRKAAAKLLSHFKRVPARAPRAPSNPAPSHAPASTCSAPVGESSPASPNGATPR